MPIVERALVIKRTETRTSEGQMSNQFTVARLLGRTVLLLLLFAAGVVASSWCAARFVLHHLSASRPDATLNAADSENPAEKRAIIDFYEASGITRSALQEFLKDVHERDGVPSYPVYITLQNEQGDYLSDNRVIIRWKTGEHRLLIGESGLVRFFIDREKLTGLRLVVPAGYATLKQRTIPLGTAYVPESPDTFPDFPFDVNWDGFARSHLNRELARLREEDAVVPFTRIRQQLRRRQCKLEFSASPMAPSAPMTPSALMTPARIFAARKPSVVVIGHLIPGAGLVQATGVVIREDGVIATAYHVLDKPTAVSRGVMTADRNVYAIREVLAADKGADVAILRIDAQGLPPAPLSVGDAEGEAVTLIAHPGGAYYSVTSGHIVRYSAMTRHGEVRVMMNVTAEFADGSSGGPLFNSRGEVTGLVSATTNLGRQMVSRIVAPVAALHNLIAPDVE